MNKKTEMVLYIEGGSGRDSNAAMREGFRRFFEPLYQLARQNGWKLRIVLCGPRLRAFRQFREGLENNPYVHHVLLVDSEGPVKSYGACWKHLRDQAQDKWKRPGGTGDANCHLMVQALEAWFIADPDALERYYGQGFQRSSLPRVANVEEIAKFDHLPSLNAATSRTAKGKYHKTAHAPDILMILAAERVRRRAPHCDRFFTTISDLLQKVQ